jgi:prefoldin beta subunit
MAQTIPPALEHEIKEYEAKRQSHESLIVMIQTMETQLRETTITLEELQKQPNDTITYKSVGQVMFKVELPKLLEDMEELKAKLERNITSYKKKYEESSTKLQELQNKLQVELSKHNLRLQ